MAITQDRMIALLDAAQDYQHAWKAAQTAFNGLHAAVERGTMTVEQAWAQSVMIMQSSLQLRSPIQTTETLTRETTHFKLMYRRNQNSAEWQRAVRAGETPVRKRLPQKRKPRPRALLEQSRLEGLGTAPASAPTTFESEYKPGNLSAEDKERIELFNSQQAAKKELEGTIANLIGGKLENPAPGPAPELPESNILVSNSTELDAITPVVDADSELEF